MNDKQRSKKIEKATEGVLRWLGFLQQHALRVSFIDELNEHPYGGQADCRVEFGYPYNWVNFVWRRDYVDHADKEALESVAVHEALHTILFAPLDEWLQKALCQRDQARYMLEQERIVDLIAHYIERRRPEHGYHASGVPNTRRSAKEKVGRSKR